MRHGSIDLFISWKLRLDIYIFIILLKNQIILKELLYINVIFQKHLSFKFFYFWLFYE